MSTKRVLVSVLALMMMSAIAAAAADLTGTWVGKAEMRPGRVMEQKIEFKMEKGKLTGTVKTSSGDREITDVKFAGDDISFATNVEMGGRKMKMVYVGKVSGDQIKFQHGPEGGDMRELVVKRSRP